MCCCSVVIFCLADLLPIWIDIAVPRWTWTNPSLAVYRTIAHESVHWISKTITKVVRLSHDHCNNNNNNISGEAEVQRRYIIREKKKIWKTRGFNTDRQLLFKTIKKKKKNVSHINCSIYASNRLNTVWRWREDRKTRRRRARRRRRQAPWNNDAGLTRTEPAGSEWRTLPPLTVGRLVRRSDGGAWARVAADGYAFGSNAQEKTTAMG